MYDPAPDSRVSGRDAAFLFLAALAVRALALAARGSEPIGPAADWFAGVAPSGIPRDPAASDAIVTLLAAVRAVLPVDAAAERVRALFQTPDPIAAAARAVLVGAGSLAVPILARAGGWLAGRWAGWTAGALLAVAPFAVES
ncbi:MAG: hypothetical protein KC591_08635, partial [Gemmatimonadetes bacterium]|nr:hypothetical protein [Gemmatimonadota bacterium]